MLNDENIKNHSILWYQKQWKCMILIIQRKAGKLLQKSKHVVFFIVTMTASNVNYDKELKVSPTHFV